MALASDVPTPSFVVRFSGLRSLYGPTTFGPDPAPATLHDRGLADDSDGIERFVDIVVEVGPDVGALRDGLVEPAVSVKHALAVE